MIEKYHVLPFGGHGVELLTRYIELGAMHE